MALAGPWLICPEVMTRLVVFGTPPDAVGASMLPDTADGFGITVAVTIVLDVAIPVDTNADTGLGSSRALIKS